MFEIKTGTPPPAVRNHAETVAWSEPIQALRDGKATYIDLGILDEATLAATRGRIKRVALALGTSVRVYREATGKSIMVLRTPSENPEDQLGLNDLP